MNKANLKEVLEGKKVQDSINADKLRKALKEVGIEVNGISDFYLIAGGVAEPINNAIIFNALANDEFLSEELISILKEPEAPEFKEGDIVTLVTEDKLKLTFIYIRDCKDKLYCIGAGQDKAGDVDHDLMRYTKSKCRLANAAEASHLKKQINELGYRLTFIDGRVDLFSMRPAGQKYFAVRFNFNEIPAYHVEEFIEDHSEFDDQLYMEGNYFKTVEEAEEAVKKAF